MAKSPELVAAVAAVVHKPNETVQVALRRLREAGLVEVTGKGRGGKTMTSRDAALLLLAMVGGSLLKDSSSTIEAYWNLLPIRTDKSVGTKRLDTGPAALVHDRFFSRLFCKSLTPLDSFGVVLTSIIEHAAKGELFPSPARAEFLDPPSGSIQMHLPTYLRLRMFAPVRSASIHAGVERLWSFRMFYGEAIELYTDSIDLPKESAGKGGYLEMRQISEDAILRIGESIGKL